MFTGKHLHAFFISNTFFNSTSMLLSSFMGWALNVTEMLLSTCKHHHTETLFIFTIFVSMSRSSSIYVVSSWFIFHFHFHFPYNQPYNVIKADTFLVHFLYALLILDDNVDQESKQFSNSKSSALRCCLALTCIFASFSLVLLIKKACNPPGSNLTPTTK